jgi:hypothetical protein
LSRKGTKKNTPFPYAPIEGVKNEPNPGEQTPSIQADAKKDRRKEGQTGIRTVTKKGGQKSGRANPVPTGSLKSNVSSRRGEKSFAPNPNAQMKRPSIVAKHRMAQPCDYL